MARRGGARGSAGFWPSRKAKDQLPAKSSVTGVLADRVQHATFLAKVAEAIAGQSMIPKTAASVPPINPAESSGMKEKTKIHCSGQFDDIEYAASNNNPRESRFT
jgi:hypothetical protein